MAPVEAKEEDSPSEGLVNLLNRKGLVKLLDVFLSKGARPLTSKQLQDFTGVSQPTVSRGVRALADRKMIWVDEDERPVQYTLNKAHPVIEGLREAHLHLHGNVDTIQRASDEYDPDSGLYHEGSPFVELFRYPTNVKLLAALLRNPEAKMSVSELASAADVESTTVRSNITLLRRIGIVNGYDPDWSSSRKYSLAQDHPATDGFLKACKSMNADLSGNVPYSSSC